MRRYGIAVQGGSEAGRARTLPNRRSHWTKSIFSAGTLGLLLSLSAASCVSDDSGEGGGYVPTLSIEGAGGEEMQVINIYLGRECVIEPEISYSGPDENDLRFSWKIGTYANGVQGESEEVSTERNLNYMFDTGGTYYVHLTVTDGRVGQAVDYQVNVNRTFEEGYLLTSTDADGGGNLVFVKKLTPEEEAAGTGPVIMEHSMESMNEGISEDGLVGAVLGTTTFPKTVSRLLVSTDEHCYVLDPNNFTAIVDMRYDDLYPGFKATDFMPDDYTPWAYDRVMRKFAHINLTYMFPYEYSSFSECEAEDFILCWFNSWGSPSLFTFFPNYSRNEVAIFYGYAVGTKFPSTGNYAGADNFLDGDDELITAFYGFAPDPETYMTTIYVLSRDKTAGTIQLWTDVAGFGTDGLNPGNFTAQDFTPTSATAVPGRNERLVPSVSNQRYYYPVGNCVYVFVPGLNFVLPDKSQYAIRFGDEEEITYMDTNLETEELYVATYDKSTERGNFYIYDCGDVRTDNSAGVKAKAAYKGCAGRIKSLIHKPSVQ